MIKKFEGYTIEIDIADDYYSAYLTITIEDEDAEFTCEDMTLVLNEGNVVFGLKEDVLKEICKKKDNIYKVLIAEGIPHQNGKDAELDYHIDFESKPKPQIKEDGTVDFKEISFLNTVKPGEVLVEKIPATEPIDGVTISGKTIKGKKGKDVQIKRGENTVLIDDDTILAAEVEGVAKIVNDRVTVMRIIEVRMVGPETGNIYFSGDVYVKEHILDGYTVTCDGDLVVGGVVEGATLKVKGSLTVGKGILGHDQSEIVVDGDLVSKFIENANVYVKGEITTGEIINSSVLCDSQITVKGKKGLIIGGEITSKYLIEANRIGSKLGVITSINLGVDASAIKELKNLKESIQELKIVEHKLDVMIPVIQTRADENPDDDGLQVMLEQYKNSLHSTRLDLEAKLKRLDELTDALKKVRKGHIKINVIYPDTVVKIGNSSYFIDHALKECIISRSDDKVIAMGF
jgi:uncharacterized protein (DUF342 family)